MFQVWLYRWRQDGKLKYVHAYWFCEKYKRAYVALEYYEYTPVLSAHAYGTYTGPRVVVQILACFIISCDYVVFFQLFVFVGAWRGSFVAYTWTVGTFVIAFVC